MVFDRIATSKGGVFDVHCKEWYQSIVAATNTRCMLSQQHLHFFFDLSICVLHRFASSSLGLTLYIMQFILAMLPYVCILFFHTVVTTRKPPSTGRMTFRHWLRLPPTSVLWVWFVGRCSNADAMTSHRRWEWTEVYPLSFPAYKRHCNLKHAQNRA